jgi:serine/tyrosine/threonine adenylyltransferase
VLSLAYYDLFMPLLPSDAITPNPWLMCDYEPALESLGEDYYDIVTAADFPQYQLRFRNDDVLPKLGLTPETVTDTHFIEAFGQFQGVRPFLALRYHGYQFGEYNSRLGDGRGFLYGQMRGTDGILYDFGTKGSGTTPYSRGGDGRLTLKGGVREVLAAEMLHRLGVRTSRCLSLIETGEQLWRGDEPSPTRSSVMIRLSQSHIRFGTFERLHYFRRADLMKQLLEHTIAVYYPHLLSATKDESERFARFYAELVQRVAELVAQWMAAGFCHAVLNTDNMSITGESFDYGPYAFIPHYNPQFTAAYFDYYGRYSYGNQPYICKLNLELLKTALSLAIEAADMETGLAGFEDFFFAHYRQCMLSRLGFDRVSEEEAEALVQATVHVLKDDRMDYHQFFIQLRSQFCREWQENAQLIFADAESTEALQNWRLLYHRSLQHLSLAELDSVAEKLRQANPTLSLVRSEIERVWESISTDDNWQPFDELLKQIKD